ncbi:MAG: hypothetical protein NTY00_00155 [Deltaproteobacteria bacterium]|nr:hypothetical protein [Deltaproteobacteria bacterium]
MQLGKVLTSRVLALMQEGQEDGGGDFSAEMALMRISKMRVK